MAVLRKLVHGRQDIKLQKPNTQLAPRKFPDNSPDWQILYKIGKRTPCSSLPRYAITCTLYQRQNLHNPFMFHQNWRQCLWRVSVDVSALRDLLTSAGLRNHPNPGIEWWCHPPSWGHLFGDGYVWWGLLVGGLYYSCRFLVSWHLPNEDQYNSFYICFHFRTHGLNFCLVWIYSLQVW